MKKFLNRLQAQAGFTLVELMVVVAIIGLLSAVALPNFRKYQAKSKTTEAKLQLAAAYTAEQAFFSDYNLYHNCLAYMGYNPSAEAPSRYYTVGINENAAIDPGAYSGAVNSGLSTDCPVDLNAADSVTFFLAGKGSGSNLAIADHLDGFTSIGEQGDSTTMTFVIGAAGVIDSGFVSNTGVNGSSAFTINEQKIISNIRQGY